MLKTRVAVLRGGPSSEYDVSLETGRSVLGALPEEKYELFDIFIDKEGDWHRRGMPVEPEQVFEQTDVVFNALHGGAGEDGTLQRFLDIHNIRYTGTGTLGSALGMNKALAKEQLIKSPFLRPLHRVFNKEDCSEDALIDLFRTFPQPCVVKPLRGGSSVGAGIVRSFDELLYAVLYAFAESDEVLVEQYIQGREATVAVAEDFRNESLYAFPPIEILPTKSSFFDYDEKYAGHAREVCPAPFTRETTDALLSAARDVHYRLGLRDYSRSDFIVHPDGIFFLEVNTLPGLTEGSLVPKAVQAVGSSLPEFLDHIVQRALSRK